jgi:hypothetical protein
MKMHVLVQPELFINLGDVHSILLLEYKNVIYLSFNIVLLGPNKTLLSLWINMQSYKFEYFYSLTAKHTARISNRAKHHHGKIKT